jgi:predicted DNA-binding transcriptional regulator AlpA
MFKTDSPCADQLPNSKRGLIDRGLLRTVQGAFNVAAFILDERTMAALLCMGASTFRNYVQRGILPDGVLIGTLRRWKVDEVSEVLDALKGSSSHSEDPYLRALRGENHGQKPSDRCHDA